MWWIINIGGLVGAWYYTDLASESTFHNMICPIFIVIFLIGTLIKFVLAIGPDSGRKGGSGDGGGGFFDGFGGDGGFGGD